MKSPGNASVCADKTVRADARDTAAGVAVGHHFWSLGEVALLRSQQGFNTGRSPTVNVGGGSRAAVRVVRA